MTHMLRIVDDLYTPLKQAAKQRGVSVAALVSIAVHDYLKLEKTQPNNVSKPAKVESMEDRVHREWVKEQEAQMAERAEKKKAQERLAAQIEADWGDDDE